MEGKFSRPCKEVLVHIYIEFTCEIALHRIYLRSQVIVHLDRFDYNCASAYISSLMIPETFRQDQARRAV